MRCPAVHRAKYSGATKKRKANPLGRKQEGRQVEGVHKVQRRATLCKSGPTSAVYNRKEKYLEKWSADTGFFLMGQKQVRRNPAKFFLIFRRKSPRVGVF